ncbi:MAG: hypothetical protein KDB03_08190 [Planctomycetales bacterium]|nr:hypothetical protein [Planctomycetales bacterium]
MQISINSFVVHLSLMLCISTVSNHLFAQTDSSDGTITEASQDLKVGSVEGVSREPKTPGKSLVEQLQSQTNDAFERALEIARVNDIRKIREFAEGYLTIVSSTLTNSELESEELQVLTSRESQGQLPLEQQRRLLQLREIQEDRQSLATHYRRLYELVQDQIKNLQQASTVPTQLAEARDAQDRSRVRALESDLAISKKELANINAEQRTEIVGYERERSFRDILSVAELQANHLQKLGLYDEARALEIEISDLILEAGDLLNARSSFANQPILSRYNTKHVQPSQVLEVIDYGSQDIQATADDRVGAIVLQGSRQDVYRLFPLIAQLDRPSSHSSPSGENAEMEVAAASRGPDLTQEDVTKENIKIYPLQNIAASDAARIVEELYDRPGQSKAASYAALTVDSRTNSLIVRFGSQGNGVEIEALIVRLDALPARQTDTNNSSIHFENAPVAYDTNLENLPGFGDKPAVDRQLFSLYMGLVDQSTSELRASYLQNEKKCRELAAAHKQVNLQPAESERIKTELRQSVERSFATRQRWQQAELTEFARRLEGIQHSIQLREKVASQIVERRVAELLDPNLKWDDLPTAEIPAPEAQPNEGANTVDVTNGSLPSMRSMPEPRVSYIPSQSNAEALLIIDKSPAEIREAIIHQDSQCHGFRSTLKNLENRIANNPSSAAQFREQIAQVLESLSTNEQTLRNIWAEHAEQVSLLENAIQSALERKAASTTKMEAQKKLVNKGYLHPSELASNQAEWNTLVLEIQRLESLLRLYRQAVAGLETPQQVKHAKIETVQLTLDTSNLGNLHWLSGPGGVNVSRNEALITLHSNASAKLSLQELPHNKNVSLRLNLTIPDLNGNAMQAAAHEALETLLYNAIPLSVTSEDIEQATNGVEIRKAVYLYRDLGASDELFHIISTTSENHNLDEIKAAEKSGVPVALVQLLSPQVKNDDK